MDVTEAVRASPMSADPFSYACLIKHYELEAAVPNNSRFENLSAGLKEQLILALKATNSFTRDRFYTTDSIASLAAWKEHLPERVRLEHDLLSLLQRVPKERGWFRRKEARRIRDFVKLRTCELDELLVISETIADQHYALTRHSAAVAYLFGYSESELLARRLERLNKLRNECFLSPTSRNFDRYRESARAFHEIAPHYEKDQCIRDAAEAAADELEVSTLMDGLA